LIYIIARISIKAEDIMQVSKWGNSLAVRLPADLVRELGLKEGDQIELVQGQGALEVQRRPRPEEVLAGLRRFRRRLPTGARLSRDAAHER
jgi:antitoxin MazE